MTQRRNTFARALMATLAATTIATAAQAANCGLVGKWHMNGDLDFPSGAAVIDCTITIKPTGAYTGTCGSWTATGPSSHSSASGTIKADRKCHLTGVLKAPGLADTTIRGGKVRGVMAVLVGSRGGPENPTQVRLVTLIKE